MVQRHVIHMNTRYIYKTVPISEEDAKKQRDKEVRRLLADIQSLRQEVDSLLESPLPTERTIQIELNPGDEGYEDAPPTLNPTLDQGTTIWINQTSASTPPAEA